MGCRKPVKTDAPSVLPSCLQVFALVKSIAREGQPLNREPHASPDDHREEEMWAAVLNADASDLGPACDTHGIRISEWRRAMLECTTA